MTSQVFAAAFVNEETGEIIQKDYARRSFARLLDKLEIMPIVTNSGDLRNRYTTMYYLDSIDFAIVKEELLKKAE